MTLNGKINRRIALRGIVAGTAVTVGLPFLDCFLNTHGTALASGAELPRCFGTFFYGLGFNPGRWEPKVIGANYEMAPELAALTPFKNKINIYSGMKCFLDGRPNVVHSTGVQVCMHGGLARSREVTRPTIDSLIADVIGTRTRFRSIEVSSAGNTRSLSSRGRGEVNPAEISPTSLYARIFGPEFQDPNAADFKPDPRVLARRSVLSGVTEQRASLVKGLGTLDRARLDQYFTSLRELEQQLDLALQKPEPLEACSTPTALKDARSGTVVDDVVLNNKLFSQMIAHTLACGQTHVFNSIFSSAASNVRRAGRADTHHVLTHEEGVDETLGVQPEVTWFNERSVDGIAALIGALDGIREGDRTLLDRTLVYVSTDTGLARIHSVDNIPLMTVGGANGRIKTGIHFHAKSDPVTRLGLTVQQLMGVPASNWGEESNQTGAAITEVMA